MVLCYKIHAKVLQFGGKAKFKGFFIYRFWIKDILDYGLRIRDYGLIVWLVSNILLTI